MARPLQKKKNKSSLPRVRQKPKSKKLLNIKSNPIVAANWYVKSPQPLHLILVSLSRAIYAVIENRPAF